MKRKIELALLILLALLIAGPPAIAHMTPLKGHKPDSETIRANLSNATVMPANRTLELQIVLKVRNKDAFDKLPDEQNDPNSPYYHHQFSREEMAKDFGPSQSDYQSVEQWLIAQGFQILSVDDSFLSRSISFTGTAAQVEGAFRVNLMQSQDGKWFSNTTDPQVPASLAGIIGYIGGLHNLAGVSAGPHFSSPEPAAQSDTAPFTVIR